MQNAKPTKTTNIHLAVQNFGPVVSADIDLRPLTVFVGQSNKSRGFEINTARCGANLADLLARAGHL